ncbi:hypothetical protein MLD38_018994 [Melastoma candidum]|uniref:Uncharacterized protein n=1 Tax=Melastoma candidum TaxID=119954 RepID=A0ACB9QW55_9MYRT|nr:hypothetical protein MLD38_018994 [Melastoma candidum]
MATPSNGISTENAAVKVGLDEKKYFQKVLDDIVSLNSWFTVAMFVGLSLATPGQVHSLESRSECDPDANIRKRLVLYEIASFSFFIFSGFLGKTAKLILYIYERKAYANPHRQLFSLMGFYLSTYGTMIGCVFLVLAMVEVVEIKLGKISCGSKYAHITMGVLISVVVPALYIYFTTITYGLYVTTTTALADRKTQKSATSLTEPRVS